MVGLCGDYTESILFGRRGNVGAEENPYVVWLGLC